MRKRRGVRGSRGRAERGHVQGRREQAGAAPAFPQPTRRLLPPAPCRAIPARPSVPRGEPGGLRVCLSVHRHGPRASSLGVTGDRVQMRVLEPRPTRSHPGKARAPPRWCRTPVPGSCRPGGTGPTPGGGLLGGPCPRLADGRQLPVSRPALGRRGPRPGQRATAPSSPRVGRCGASVHRGGDSWRCRRTAQRELHSRRRPRSDRWASRPARAAD